MKTTLLAAAVAALGIIAGGSATVSAAVMDGTLQIDEAATLKPNGRAIVVTGEVQCDAGERVQVTVNPAAGTPKAVGRTAFSCDGTMQSFELVVRMKGNGTKFSELASSSVQVSGHAASGGDADSVVQTVSWAP